MYGSTRTSPAPCSTRMRALLSIFTVTEVSLMYACMHVCVHSTLFDEDEGAAQHLYSDRGVSYVCMYG